MKDSSDNANRNKDSKNKNKNKIKGGKNMKKDDSRQRKRHKSPNSLNHSIYFFYLAATIKCVHKKSQEIDQTVPVVAERDKDQKKDKDLDNVAIDTKIATGPKTQDKKIVTQDPKTEKRKSTTETAETETTRNEATNNTKNTKNTRSQKSIRRNTRRTDLDQRKEIIQMKDETEINILNELVRVMICV